MADENKLGGGPLGDPKQAASTIKSLAQETGNFNEGVKESLNLLKQVVKSYEKMDSVLANLKTETINIKQIEKERERATREQYTTNQKLGDLEKQLGVDRVDKVKQYTEKLKEQEDAAKKIKDLSATIKEMESAGIAVEEEKASLVKLFADQKERSKFITDNTLDAQELELAALSAANKQAKERVELAGEYLKTEKEVQERLGKTGALVGFVSKNLGIGKDLYAKMVEEARKDEGITKLKVIGMASLVLLGKGLLNTLKSATSAIGDGMNSLTGTGGPLSKATSQFTNLMKQIPLVGGLLGGIAEIGVNLLDMLVGTNSETQKFGRSLGISSAEAKRITNEFVQISVNSGAAYLNVEKLRQSQKELSETLGINKELSAEILKSDAQLREQAGLELDTRSQLAQAAIITNKSQTQIYTTLIGQTAKLKEQLGVNIRVQDTVKEASRLSGVLGLTFAKYPAKLTESLLIVKSLGLDLQKVDSIASGILNFEESISKEFEAQLITGKDVNLNKAREFALNNDLAGVATEISKQFKSSSEFLGMNRIAAESLAASVGMTRDEVADMLKKQELYFKAGAKNEDEFKRNIALMKERGTLQSEFIDKLGEQEAKMFLSSTATESMSNFIDKIKQGFANLLDSPAFKKFLDSFMQTLSDPNFAENLINKLTSFAQTLAKIAGMIVQSIGYVVNAADYLTFGSIPNEVPKNLIKMGEGISSISIGNASLKANAPSPSNSNSASPNSNTGPSSLNAKIDVYVDDNQRNNSIRMLMASSQGYNTGPFGR